MASLFCPQDLNMMASDAEMEKMEEERKAKKKKQQQERELREAFSSRDIHPEAVDRINHAVTVAAKRGEHQVQVLTFPCTYCNDGGRRINNLEKDWPQSLEGFAKKAHEFFEKELRPLGYKLHAEVISYPGGMPGDVGMFLRW
jgi:hypothetical protein